MNNEIPLELNLTDLALDQVPEVKIVEPGQHEVRCLKIKVTEHDKEGSDIKTKMITVQCELADDVNKEIDFVYYRTFWPHPEDESRNKNKSLATIRDLVLAFHGDINNNRLEQIVGNTAEAVIGIDTYQGRESAVIKKFVVPKAAPSLS